MARSWDSSLVREMLARADQSDTPGGRSAYRPDTLPEGFGLLDDGLYRLSDTQAQELLNMRLQRLTGLEQDKIVGEYKDIMDRSEARRVGKECVSTCRARGARWHK